MPLLLISLSVLVGAATSIILWRHDLPRRGWPQFSIVLSMGFVAGLLAYFAILPLSLSLIWIAMSNMQ